PRFVACSRRRFVTGDKSYTAKHRRHSRLVEPKRLSWRARGSAAFFIETPPDHKMHPPTLRRCTAGEYSPDHSVTLTSASIGVGLFQKQDVNASTHQEARHA